MSKFDDYDTETKLAVIANDLVYVKEKLNAVDEKVSTHYVSRAEFDPIKQIVYGLVSLILIAVVGALVALVVQAKPTPSSPNTSDQQKTAQK